ncbi:MAG: 4-hydroxy-tetrahydrodipicolinate synthase [Planctomycetaceae bacterium]|jgi:4-hydroxy-tetrahydrodipicolinate synthase|nr:4-hydroxy-tetrahydrodipicolinate synthase [Planctomycetaceae bacterium]
MTRKGAEFSGLSVAITTPFRNGEVDIDGLKRQVEFHVAAGTNCLCPVGTTGESPTLTHDENEKVIAEVVQAAAGRIQVMAGTGSNSTSEALRLTKRAAADGADAALVVAPYYNKPTQQGFIEHYRAIAETIDLPICVYNIPGRTGKNIEPDSICRLGELENIALVKEATGSLDQASEILNNSNLTLLSGDDSLTLPLLSIGGSGVISVVGNIVPQDMMALISAFNSGDIAAAQQWHHKLFPLCRDMLGLSTNPIPIKAAMAMLGMDSGELRLPMTPLNDSEVAQLRKTLENYGLL